MVVHCDAVDGTVGPCPRVLDDGPGAELEPQTEEHVLDRVLGLDVGEALPADEAEQGLAVPKLEVTDHEISLGWIGAGDVDGRDTLHEAQCRSSHHGLVRAVR